MSKKIAEAKQKFLNNTNNMQVKIIKIETQNKIKNDFMRSRAEAYLHPEDSRKR